MTIRVTVVDTNTGLSETTDIPEHDYAIICADDCYVSNTQVLGSIASQATHVITVKRGPSREPTGD